LLLAQLDELFAPLLNFKLKSDFLQQEVHNLELEHLPPRVLISVPRYRKQALEQLLAQGQTGLLADLAVLLDSLLLGGTGQFLLTSALPLLLEVLYLLGNAEVFVVELDEADVAGADVEQKQLLVEHVLREALRQREDATHKRQHGLGQRQVNRRRQLLIRILRIG